MLGVLGSSNGAAFKGSFGRPCQTDDLGIFPTQYLDERVIIEIE